MFTLKEIFVFFLFFIVFTLLLSFKYFSKINEKKMGYKNILIEWKLWLL